MKYFILFFLFFLFCCSTPKPVLLDDYKKVEVSDEDKQRFYHFWFNPVWKSKYQENIPMNDKIAGLAKVWSTAKYNFVYFHHVKKLNWDKEFVSYLEKVKMTQTTYEYYLLLMTLVNKLQDGQTKIILPNELFDAHYAKPNIELKKINDEIVISKVHDKSDVKVGDKIIKINGVRVSEYAEKYIQPTSASSSKQDRDRWVLEMMLLTGANRSNIDLTIKGLDNNNRYVVLKRGTEWLNQTETEMFEFKPIYEIAYLKIKSFDHEDTLTQFKKLLPEILKSKALIIDLRGNRGGSSPIAFEILSHFVDKAYPTVSWKTRRYEPARMAWSQHHAFTFYPFDVDHWSPQMTSIEEEKDGKKYLKPIILLTETDTYSAAENFALVFKNLKRGKIIGRATGGSSGQPMIVDLPGGGYFSVCSKLDSNPDGTEYVGIGIIPDIIIEPNYEDLINNRDTVLEKALSIINY